jgi:hypothetical protein
LLPPGIAGASLEPASWCIPVSLFIHVMFHSAAPAAPEALQRFCK